MKYDYIIVGAGIAGCVFAERISSQQNKSVLIVDTRDHIGGNCFDYYNEDGILIHKYGPHWFHTNDLRLVTYLSRFTSWHEHQHRVLSSVHGETYPFPINRDTLNQLYNFGFSTETEVQDYYNSVREKHITKPCNAEEMIVSQIGWNLYRLFFRNYTIKQWNMSPTELDPFVTARIPVRFNSDDRYFTDVFQGLPADGYTSMFSKMLEVGNITVQLNTDYKNILSSVCFDHMIYTGPIDYFFDHKFGSLPYRSLRFQHETHRKPYYQSCQQINYPNEHEYTRIVEWKHATGQRHPYTTITKEFPCPHDGTNEKLYPILTKENLGVLSLYKAEADKLSNVTFCGRLAEYKYYNMDQVVARALHIFQKKISLIAQ